MDAPRNTSGVYARELLSDRTEMYWLNDEDSFAMMKVVKGTDAFVRIDEYGAFYAMWERCDPKSQKRFGGDAHLGLMRSIYNEPG